LATLPGCEGNATTLGGRISDPCPAAPATPACGVDLVFDQVRIVHEGTHIQIRYERADGQPVVLIDIADSEAEPVRSGLRSQNMPLPAAGVSVCRTTISPCDLPPVAVGQLRLGLVATLGVGQFSMDFESEATAAQTDGRPGLYGSFTVD
jgi:hypothetical protein